MTDVLALEPAVQRLTLEQAHQRIRSDRVEGWTPARSPDGQFIFTETQILGATTQALVNEVRGTGPASACRFGWRPDSSGYYFIDRSRKGLSQTGPGPIRVLLVRPPPRSPVQFLPLVGTGVALAGVGYWLWRRRRVAR